MLKKIIKLTGIMIMVCCLTVGCGIKRTQDGFEISASQSEETFPDLGLSLADVGKGEFFIITGGGTSVDNQIPVIYLQTENTSIQIAYEMENFEQTKLTYLYIDGKLIDSTQMSPNSRGTISLDGDFVKKGIHKIELLQYKDNEENKDINNIYVYKYAQYKITDNVDEYNTAKAQNTKAMPKDENKNKSNVKIKNIVTSKNSKKNSSKNGESVWNEYGYDQYGNYNVYMDLRIYVCWFSYYTEYHNDYGADDGKTYENEGENNNYNNENNNNENNNGSNNEENDVNSNDDTNYNNEDENSDNQQNNDENVNNEDEENTENYNEETDTSDDNNSYEEEPNTDTQDSNEGNSQDTPNSSEPTEQEIDEYE